MDRIEEKTLIKWQAYTGLAFASFLVLHISNTMVAAFSQSGYNLLQSYLRFYYQFLPVEIVVVSLSLVTHVCISILRLQRRKNRERGKVVRRAPLRLRLHRYTGYYLLLVVFGHIFATRSPSLDNVEVGFSFLSFSLYYWPYFFYPYYFLFITSGIYHLLNGVLLASKALNISIPKNLAANDSRLFFGIVATLCVMGIISVLSFGGFFYEIDATRFAEYRLLYEKIAPAMFLPWL